MFSCHVEGAIPRLLYGLCDLTSLFLTTSSRRHHPLIQQFRDVSQVLFSISPSSRAPLLPSLSSTVSSFPFTNPLISPFNFFTHLFKTSNRSCNILSFSSTLSLLSKYSLVNMISPLPLRPPRSTRSIFLRIGIVSVVVARFNSSAARVAFSWCRVWRLSLMVLRALVY